LGFYRPSVRHKLYFMASEVYHRLDGDRIAHGKSQTLSPYAVIRDVGRLMHVPAYSVPHHFSYHAIPVADGVFGHCCSYISQTHSVAEFSEGFEEAFFRDFDEFSFLRV